jgi:hypothetical protein
VLGSGLLSGTRLSVGIRVQVKDQANTGIGVVVCWLKDRQAVTELLRALHGFSRCI